MNDKIVNEKTFVFMLREKLNITIKELSEFMNSEYSGVTICDEKNNYMEIDIENYPNSIIEDILFKFICQTDYVKNSPDNEEITEIIHKNLDILFDWYIKDDDNTIWIIELNADY